MRVEEEIVGVDDEGGEEEAVDHDDDADLRAVMTVPVALRDWVERRGDEAGEVDADGEEEPTEDAIPQEHGERPEEYSCDGRRGRRWGQRETARREGAEISRRWNCLAPREAHRSPCAGSSPARAWARQSRPPHRSGYPGRTRCPSHGACTRTFRARGGSERGMLASSEGTHL